jgi:prepilin-type N-terminal cleavage/methylation domain-containing protein
MKKINRQSGFTLTEMLVTVAIVALLSSLLLVYTQTGNKQIALYKDQAKFVGDVLRARSMTLQRIQSEDEQICGYGISFTDERHYFLYKDAISSGTKCSDATTDRKYTSEAEKLEEFELSPGVEFTSRGAADILFTPPDPRVYLDGGRATSDATFELGATTDNRVSVIINSAGQVTTQ